MNEAGQTAGYAVGSRGAGYAFWDGERVHFYDRGATAGDSALTGQPPAAAGFNALGQLVVNIETPLVASLRLNPGAGPDLIYRPGRP